MKNKKFLHALLNIKVISLFIACFLPITGPHEWRQFDTLGLTLRYYIEFFESSISKYPKLIPAVLQAGDHLGITPTELPIINILLSPLYYFGENIGQTLVFLFLLVINIQLFYWNAKQWKDQSFLGFEIGHSFLLIPIFSFTGVYFGKFMPDTLSVLLVLTSVTLINQKLNNKNLFLSTILGSIGLLLKPTSLLVYSLCFQKKIATKFKSYIAPALSILLTIFYYKIITPKILSFTHEASLFSVTTKTLDVAIKQIIEKAAHFIDIFLKNSMGGWIIIIYFIILISLKNKDVFKRHAKLWTLVIAQLVFIHLLTGDHPFWHNYYYLGISLFLCIGYYDLINLSNKASRYLLIAGIAVPMVLRISYDIKPLLKPNKKVAWNISTQCHDLKKKNPDFPWERGYHFRSDKESFPVLGTCFGEIQNAKQTQFGFYKKETKIPADCQTVDQSKDLVLIKCHP